jgi:hypothetical protein
MQTDSTEEQAYGLLAYDGGFTQAWDTVGAGIKIPRQRELDLGERRTLQ